MASLTVRQLDDKLKKLLRLRAARHSRSMEDEVRVILRQAAEETGREILDHFELPNQPARRKTRADTASGPRVLLIIGGGIAAYKSLDLIRRLQDRGASVRCILTPAAQHFVTPLAVGALAGERAHTDLFDPQSEFDVGHIRLARDTDLIVVAPAKMCIRDRSRATPNPIVIWSNRSAVSRTRKPLPPCCAGRVWRGSRINR